VKREEKENQVKELSRAFQSHDTFYLLDFMHMPVSQSMQLRRRLRDQSYSFRVIKNRLALRSLTEDLPDDLKEFFQGPTAIAFAPQDPIGLARILRDFSTQYKVLSIKAGLFEGQFLPPQKFEEIANLTSREDLLAKLGFLMSYPLTKLLRTWQAPLDSLGRLLSQLKTKK
jgi:large subunit ribosomal protein L10